MRLNIVSHARNIRNQARAVYTVSICAVCQSHPHLSPKDTHLAAEDWPGHLSAKEMSVLFELAPELSAKLLSVKIAQHLKFDTVRAEDTHLTMSDWPRSLSANQTRRLIRLVPKLVAKMARANAIPM